MIDAAAIRRQSQNEAKRLGYAVNPSLPLLDELSVVRNKDAVVDRVLVLACLVAIAHGARRGIGESWLKQEGLFVALTPAERKLLAGEQNDREMETFRGREEAAWALVWALGFVDQLDFSTYCQPTLAGMFPRIRDDEPSAKFRAKARLRTSPEIVAQADLAYCLHWASRDAVMHRRRPPPHSDPYVVEERRRALDWLIREEDWDDLALDT